MQMLSEHGGLETARRLLAKDDPQAGLFRLYDIGLLDESLEAVVLRPKFPLTFHRSRTDGSPPAFGRVGVFWEREQINDHSIGY